MTAVGNSTISCIYGDGNMTGRGCHFAHGMVIVDVERQLERK